MYLTGYHGTKRESAESILSENGFIISKGDKHWLGDGIYFYPNFGDALNWKYEEKDEDVEVVIHGIIKIEDDEYLDIESDEGKKIFKDLVRELEKSADVHIKMIQENQNAVCKAIWNKYPKLRVMVASFPEERTKYPTLIDTRKRRKEFCIRGNDAIVYMNIIERNEIND